jgi:hypothetical protein
MLLLKSTLVISLNEELNTFGLDIGGVLWLLSMVLGLILCGVESLTYFKRNKRSAD